MNKQDVLTYLTKHKRKLARRFGVKKIGIFGSYARETNHELSDLDVVVELDKPDMFAIIGIKQMIEEELGVKVDIVRLRNTMNPYLKKRIEKDVFYI